MTKRTATNQHKPHHNSLPSLPQMPAQLHSRPFVRFLHIESAGGIALMVCTVIALIIANSPLSDAYASFWNQIVRVGVGDHELAHPLWHWINDGLMTIFFFVIGLEIKREITRGELSDRRTLALPLAAAIGGALVPAIIFLTLQRGQAGENGWAIPMATDIAFVIGFLALLGSRVPRSLKLFVLALAIIDDILAVSVIAIFYTESISGYWLACAAIGYALTALLNRIGVRAIPIYVFVGIGIWFFTLKSGVHPTVAGVLLGLMTPASAYVGSASLLEVTKGAVLNLGSPSHTARRKYIDRLNLLCREAVSPLERLELGLHPWVAFAIVPLFALANAGIELHPAEVTDPVAIAVAAGLILGKPLGILIPCWIMFRMKWATLPVGVTWPAIVGVSCLAGIGFTMSLFIAPLELEGAILASAKTGILTGSLVSGSIGLLLLAKVLPRSSGTCSVGKDHL